MKIRFFSFFIAAVLSVPLFAQSDPQSRYFEISKNLEVFNNLYRELNTHYVDELDPNQLMKAAIDGMLGSLDPYTVYYSANQIERFRFDKESKFEGLGADYEEIDGAVYIVEPFEGFAADKAGIEAGDMILSINGEDMRGMTVEEVADRLRGAPGSTFTMKVKNTDGEEKSVTITREEVNQPSVTYSDYVADGIGYVNLHSFSTTAAPEVGKAIRKMKEEGELNGLILDLRNNSGGLLHQAVNIIDLFLPEHKVVVTTRSKIFEESKSYKTQRPALYPDLPLVVLINERSASASEIVAGTLQDYDRAIILGQRSYGKGLVQNHRNLPFQSRMKVTISRYYLPSGRSIQAVSYENGEPVDIPESERTTFYTETGRPVTDGGGIKPDILIEKKITSPILHALKDQNIIFKFLNQRKLPHIEDPFEYEFEDMKDFKNFVEATQINYETDLDKRFVRLKADLEKQGMEDAAEELEKIRRETSLITSDDIKDHEEEIEKYIGGQIILRKHYRKGMVAYSLQKDDEIDKAVDILNSPKDYRKLLIP